MRTLALAALVLAACGVPAREPDITGQVTRLSDSGPDRVVVLVEENPADVSGSLKAAVTVDANTRVLHRTDTGDVGATRADLRAGLRVSVWFTGPVAESYPVQAKAETVLILAPR